MRRRFEDTWRREACSVALGRVGDGESPLATRSPSQECETASCVPRDPKNAAPKKLRRAAMQFSLEIF